MPNVARQGCQFEVHGVGRANNGARGVKAWRAVRRRGAARNSENREQGSDSLEKKRAENPFKGEGLLLSCSGTLLRDAGASADTAP